jgi:SWI/SNF-related matrix-associated actin-dependent regulator 1 of chromatin subfamily A
MRPQSFLSSDDDVDYESLFQSEIADLAPLPRLVRKPIHLVILPANVAASKSEATIHTDLSDEQTMRFTHFPPADPIFRLHGGIEIFQDDRRYWSVPLNRFRALKAALYSPSNRFAVRIECMPESILTGLLTFRAHPTRPSDLESLPVQLLTSLFPHQKESVLYGISRGFRVFIADDMGLGKTIEAIGIACAAGFPNRLRVLVMSPGNMTASWIDAFLRWTNICQSSINVVTKPETIARTPLTIVSFTMAVRTIDYLSRIEYNMIVLDESHELKNAKTQTYKTLLPLISQVKYLVLLSGTPTLNRPAELFPQLQLLLPRIFPSFKSFALRYCQACSHSEELRIVLEHLVMIRRQKTDVLTDLPLKKRIHVKLEFSPSPALIECLRSRRPDFSVGMTKAFSMTAREKLPIIINWLSSPEFRHSFFHEHRKCLIFAHHLAVLNGLREWIQANNIGCICVSGSTLREQREAQFARFRSDPECRIAILSIEIAATGLTLVEASLVVFAELKWTPAEHQQAEDRVHRIGQERDVEIYYLHAVGSADDRMWEILESKLVMISTLIASSTISFETNTDAR